MSCAVYVTALGTKCRKLASSNGPDVVIETFLVLHVQRYLFFDADLEVTLGTEVHDVNSQLLVIVSAVQNTCVFVYGFHYGFLCCLILSHSCSFSRTALNSALLELQLKTWPSMRKLCVSKCHSRSISAEAETFQSLALLPAISLYAHSIIIWLPDLDSNQGQRD